MRIFVTDDYPALVDVYNASWHRYPTTLAQLQTQDQAARRHPASRFQRYVVERQGHIVAFGQYDQPPRFYEPGRFRASIFVHPQYQRQGIGTRLYQRLIEELGELNTFTLWARIREDMPGGVQFASKQNFYEELRVWELRLTVANFDVTPYATLNNMLDAQGIEIKTLKELESDPERYQKLYDITKEAGQDLPPTEHWALPSYDDFKRDTLVRTAEAYFVALKENNYIGLSYLTEYRQEHYCGIGFTGVRRAYRRQGIALALKLHGIAYARQHAYTSIRTTLDSANRASFAMNERLGFVKQPAWIVFAKEFTPRYSSQPA